MYRVVMLVIFIFNTYIYEQNSYSSQPIAKWLKLFEHDSGTESYFMMNVLENLKTFLIKFPLKRKASRDIYVFDSKPDIEVATLLSATKTHRNIKYQMLGHSIFKI